MLTEAQYYQILKRVVQEHGSHDQSTHGRRDTGKVKNSGAIGIDSRYRSLRVGDRVILNYPPRALGAPKKIGVIMSRVGSKGSSHYNVRYASGASGVEYFKNIVKDDGGT